MDCTWITAMRTGAATAVSAKYCARKDSEIVGVLACGVQGRTNLEALSLVCPGIKEVRAYDIDGDAQDRYVNEMAGKSAFTVRGAKTPRETVEGADIIVTSGPILKHPTPVIEKSWLKKGVFISPVDFDTYVKPEILAEADRFITDDRAQILYYQSQGYFKTLPPLIDELNDVVAGKIPGRVNNDELIVGMNLGISLLDMGSARLLYDRAKERKKGIELPL
jgi:ornithine cyclodeaminase/alanine dehydrogenase